MISDQKDRRLLAGLFPLDHFRDAIGKKAGELEAKEAEMTIAPGSFFPDREKKAAYFGEAELGGIRKLLDETQPRIQWFRENESLFYDKEG